MSMFMQPASLFAGESSPKSLHRFFILFPRCVGCEAHCHSGWCFRSQLVLRKQQNEVPKNRRNSLHKGLLQTSVSLVLHTGLLPSPLISDALLFGRLWYGEPDAISNAIGYAKFYSRSHAALIRVYDEPGNVIETHENTGDFKGL
jgi:hypothetical protein